MRALEASGRFLGDSSLDQCFQIVRIGAQAFLELLEATLENPALTVGDLEISARYSHALVEREGARESENRLLRQPFSEVEDSEVVVRARVRRIDSASERPKDVDLT